MIFGCSSIQACVIACVRLTELPPKRLPGAAVAVEGEHVTARVEPGRKTVDGKAVRAFTGWELNRDIPVSACAGSVPARVMAGRKLAASEEGRGELVTRCGDYWTQAETVFVKRKPEQLRGGVHGPCVRVHVQHWKIGSGCAWMLGKHPVIT